MSSNSWYTSYIEGVLIAGAFGVDMLITRRRSALYTAHASLVTDPFIVQYVLCNGNVQKNPMFSTRIKTLKYLCTTFHISSDVRVVVYVEILTPLEIKPSQIDQFSRELPSYMCVHESPIYIRVS